MQSEFDCVIVGAGFVGAALGLGLASCGLKVAVLDHLPPPAQPEHDPRGLALAPSTVSLLSRLQVWPALQAHATPIETVHVTHHNHFGSLRLRHRELGVPALGYVCPAPLLQASLAGALQAAGITVNWSSRLLATHATAAANELHIETSGTRAHWTTALLVGADGIASGVRRLLGIKVDQRDYGQTSIVANIDVDAPRPHTAYERFTTGGPLALLPLGGRRYVAVRTARTEDVAALSALSEDAYLADLNQRFGSCLGAFTQLGTRRTFALVQQRARELHRPRAVLIGNAANTLHPNAAQGLNLGFRDVTALLKVLTTARTNGADLGDALVLAEYASARAPDHRATSRLTDGLARTFGIEHWAVGVLRSTALIALDRVVPLKRALLRQVIGNRK